LEESAGALEGHELSLLISTHGVEEGKQARVSRAKVENAVRKVGLSVERKLL
jgi:hypothetical protein